MIYRHIQDQVAHYYVYCDGATQKIDPFTYFCKTLEIIKDSRPSEEAVRLASGTSENVYKRIQIIFLRVHRQFEPYQHLFAQFDNPQNSDLSKTTAILSPTQSVQLLALVEKYGCQPLIATLQPKKRSIWTLWM